MIGIFTVCRTGLTTTALQARKRYKLRSYQRFTEALAFVSIPRCRIYINLSLTIWGLCESGCPLKRIFTFLLANGVHNAV